MLPFTISYIVPLNECSLWLICYGAPPRDSGRAPWNLGPRGGPGQARLFIVMEVGILEQRVNKVVVEG